MTGRRTAAFAAIIGLLVGCGPIHDAALHAVGDAGGTDAGLSDASSARATDAAADSGALGALPPVDMLAWPHEPSALPPCTPSGLGFSLPALEHAGRVALAFSAPLQPRGVAERLHVSVLTADNHVDTSYNGALTWSLPSSVTVVETSNVVAGQATATLRFAEAGTMRAQVGLDGDPRQGYADVLIYAPQLPIWELEVAPADLANIVEHPNDDVHVSATLRIDGKPHPTQLRLHGASSRFFPKKSFRFDLEDVADGTWGTHLIVRAEYNDKTMLRNWLSMQLFHDSTWLPAPRVQFVHLRINAEYYGVMNNVERIDGAFLKERGMSLTASLYESDQTLSTAARGNLSVLPDAMQYRDVYTHQRGMVDYDDLIALIEKTLVLPAAEFERVSRREIAVDEYLVYRAMMVAIQNQDDLRKNFYLYRDANSPWLTLPWDLDLTFGHLWSEESDVFEEAVVADSDIYLGVHTAARGEFYNQLTDRLLRTPSYRTRYRTMLDKLMASFITRKNAERLITNVLCRATADLVADTHKRATNTEYLGRVAELYDYIDARAAYIRKAGNPVF
jgi:spore coat protein H